MKGCFKGRDIGAGHFRWRRRGCGGHRRCWCIHRGTRAGQLKPSRGWIGEKREEVEARQSSQRDPKDCEDSPRRTASTESPSCHGIRPPMANLGQKAPFACRKFDISAPLLGRLLASATGSIFPYQNCLWAPGSAKAGGPRLCFGLDKARLGVLLRGPELWPCASEEGIVGNR